MNTNVVLDEGAFHVPRQLVYLLLATFFATMVSVAGYMVVWARADAVWKATTIHEIRVLSEKLGELKKKVDVGVLEIARERLANHEKRLERLEGSSLR